MSGDIKLGNFDEWCSDTATGTITLTVNDPYITPSIAVTGDLIKISDYPIDDTNMATSLDYGIGQISLPSDVDWYKSMGNYFEKEQIYSDFKQEQEIRERNPGIQAAWEQYKILVELAKIPPEDLTD